MSTAVAHSTSLDPALVADEISGKLGGLKPTMVVFFASSRLDPAGIATAMSSAFPQAAVFGCTTAGELMTGAMLTDSCVAMAFDAVHVPDVQVEVVEGLSRGVNVSLAFEAFQERFGMRPSAMSAREYVGLVLVDGLSGAEEALMEALGDRTDVLFVGGSAGDDLAFERTHVFANGRAYSDAAVLALLRPAVPFEIVKTQSFDATGKTLVASHVDEAAREVLEFDGKPAVQAYAEAIGVAVDDAAASFMAHPLGLVIDGEPYVRSPQRVLDNGAIKFYCNIGQGMKMTVLDSTDMIEQTRQALAESAYRLGSASAIVNFNCILRTLQLRAEGRTESYGQLFAEVPTVGFSTYGEEYLGHINQTATMLLFG